jgi:hypothetical protein
VVAKKKTKRKKRDYAKEYRDFGGKPEQKKRRAARNAARRKAIKKYGKKALKGKEVHHINAPRKGNLRKVRTAVVSKKYNRKKQPKRGGKRYKPGARY